MTSISAAATHILAVLPPGKLPLWMLFVSSLGIFNSVQNLFTNKLTKQVYAGRPEQVTPLAARLFATWTWSVSMIRIYAAFHLQEKL
ncbi:Erg28 like protein-domain-containing protein [Jimgerdemannia flammicorona]|uniref:Erg28 like protein-domain-containing protein n=1 Tax=Jimgerdemannia flammicorona TaxID=994334 RepID=A0A433Q919_9FUNG|nr:Erg28 like protein-domain-containing protein [Jimgerdemannia flammicorona]